MNSITRPKPQPGLLRTASLKAGKPTLAAKPKTRECEVCRHIFPAQRMGQKVCSPRCAKKHAEAIRKAERKDLKARKEAIKTRSDWMSEAQAAFNAYRREWCRVNGYTTCPDCGEPLDWNSNKVDAGHYRSVGSAPHMRFVENNVWAQRKQCNRYGAGRAVDYRIGLIARIGLEAVEALEADNTPRKYTIDELKAIKTEYTAKRRALAMDKGVE
jgi:hypothetical protein